MSGRTVFLRGAGMLSAAELSCQVQEENKARRELYTAEWRDLSLSTRDESGCSMREVNDHRKETYAKSCEVQFVVQRSPWNVMKLGHLGEVQREYHLPYQRALPLPIFSTSRERVHTSQEMSRMIELENAQSYSGYGLCLDQKKISKNPRDLPSILRLPNTEFRMTSLEQSLYKPLSQEVQRG
ncbi:telethonin-like [Lissotriton helveticus]